MKKENKIVANLLKEYYRNISIINLIKKQIKGLENSNFESLGKKIESLNDKITIINDLNCQMDIIMNELKESMESEFEVIENKFKYGKNNAQMCTNFPLNNSSIWQKENRAYSFIYQSLDDETLRRGKELSFNKNLPTK